MPSSAIVELSSRLPLLAAVPLFAADVACLLAATAVAPLLAATASPLCSLPRPRICLTPSPHIFCSSCYLYSTNSFFSFGSAKTNLDSSHFLCVRISNLSLSLSVCLFQANDLEKSLCVVIGLSAKHDFVTLGYAKHSCTFPFT